MQAEVETCRPEGLYRYVVRCDRARALAIGRAAKRAGMSETAFVQAHFDRILDPAPALANVAFTDAAASPDEARPGEPRPGDSERAADLGFPAYVLRIWRVVSTLAPEGGSFDADNIALGKASDVAVPSVKNALAALINRGFITRETMALQGKLARFRLDRREG